VTNYYFHWTDSLYDFGQGLHFLSNDTHLKVLAYDSNWPLFCDEAQKCVMEQNDIIKKAIEQIQEYLAGQRKVFDIPFDANGTFFQKKVWRELEKIPYGVTRSYSEQATLMGQPRATRAVASANARNPLSILVPCHRVVRADAQRGGYAGGLFLKNALLDLEGSGTGLRRVKARRSLDVA
jgi:methylated-DNA-[protein]-cysteine S-methyltransferase